MALRILSTEGYGRDAGVKVLVYGAPGAGKTRLCATAPKPFILSAESGLLSLRNEKLPYAVISDIKDLTEAYAWFTGSEEANEYQTICLDSISEIAEQVLSTEKASSKDGRKAYGEMQDRMNRLLRAFRDIPGKNVYFSAKMERTQMDNGLILYTPYLPGKNLTQGIGYFFDEEFALIAVKDSEGNVNRYLQTFSDTAYEAKDRSGALDFYEEPDLTKIFNKISGGEDA